MEHHLVSKTWISEDYEKRSEQAEWNQKYRRETREKLKAMHF